MKNDIITDYVETGVAYLKEVTQWPESLLPGLPGVAKQLGDTGMLELVEPLGLAERIQTTLKEAPEPDGVQPEAWREGIRNWSNVHQTLPVMLALLRAGEKIEAAAKRPGEHYTPPG